MLGFQTPKPALQPGVLLSTGQQYFMMVLVVHSLIVNFAEP